MEYSVEGESISNIADAIRERSGSEDPMTLSQMPGLIRNLPGGGGEGHKVTISLNSSSHQYSADASYADISGWLSNSEYVYAEYNGDIFLLNKYTNEVVDFVQVEDINDGTKAFLIRIFEIRTQGGPVGYSVTGSPIIYAPGSSNVGKYLQAVETGTGTYAYEPNDLPEEEQIISYADYMALTEAQKNNGKSYYIYDAQNEGREIQPVIYSLDEREIGVWTDGKPLYQKTFITTAYWEILHSNTWTPTGIILSNCDRLVSIEFSDETGKSIETSGMIAASNYELNLMSSRVSGYNAGVNISLKYTKTTDTPGSGHFVPSGVPAVHYDGNEKIIGTWFGETLYEKTISCGDGGSNTTVIVPHNISNLKRVVKLFGCSEDGDPIPTVNGGGDFIRLASTPQYIRLKYADSWATHTSIYVTIQYTKTS